MNIFKSSTPTKPDYKKLHSLAKSALDAAATALQSATSAQAKVTKELDVKVQAAQQRFDQDGSADAAHDLEISESSRTRVTQWHNDRVAKLSEERDQARDGEVTALTNLKAAQLLEVATLRARSLPTVSRAIEGLLGAVANLPAVDMEALQDERVREAVRAIQADFFGSGHELDQVVKAGFARPSGTANSATGLASVLNVSVAAMDDPLSALYIQAHAVLGEFIKDVEGRRIGTNQIARSAALKEEDKKRQLTRETAKEQVVARLLEIERAAHEVMAKLGPETTHLDADRIDVVVKSIRIACREAKVLEPSPLESRALLAMRGFWNDPERRIEDLTTQQISALQKEKAA